MLGLKTLSEIENPSDRGKIKLFGAVGIVAGLAFAGLPAQAAHAPARVASKPEKAKVTALASKDVETTSSIRTDVDDGLNCARSRKRLWVESEGWIVRQVTTCY